MTIEVAIAFSADLLAIVLGASAIAKLRDLEGFIGIVSGYGAIPPRAQRIVGYAVPAFESTLAVLLLSNHTRALAGLVAVAFFVTTAGVVGLSLILRRTPKQCGCFGLASTSRPSWALVGIDLLLASMSVAVMEMSRGGIASPAIDAEAAVGAVLLALLMWALSSLVAVRNFERRIG